MADSDSPISRLPPELKLGILKFVDNITIRQSVSLVNKEFNELSKDFSLYERYESAEYDVNGVKLCAELRHELYRKHLKVLVTSVSVLRIIRHLEFSSLVEVVVNCSDERYVIPWIPLLKSSKNVKYRVRGNCSPDVEEHVSSVKTIIMTPSTFSSDALHLPAERFVLKTFNLENDLKMIRSADTTNVLGQNNFGIELGNSSDRLLHEGLADFLQLHVTSFTCMLNSTNPAHRELITVVCRDWVALEQLELVLNDISELPELSVVVTKGLRNLELNTRCFDSIQSKQWCSQKIFGSFRLLIEAVKGSLTLNHFDSSCLADVGLKITTLKLINCDVTCDSLLKMNGLDCVEFLRCELLDSQVTEERAFVRRLACSSMRDDAVNTLLQLIHSDVVRIIFNVHSVKTSGRRHLNVMNDVLDVIKVSFNHHEVEQSGARCINVLNDVLEMLLARSHRLHVFDYYRKPSPVFNEETLKLLKKFDNLDFIDVRCRLEVSRATIRQYFPAAIIRIYSEQGMLKLCL